MTSYDDALNSASHMYLKGGYIYAVATGNDAIDANGNLNLDGGYIYAAGREEAFDANEQYKLYVNSGVSFIAYGATMGALESGAQLNQTCYSASTYSGGSRYALYNGNQVAFAVTAATISGGGPGFIAGPGGPGGNSAAFVVSSPSSTALKSGVTFSGTTFWTGKGATSATGGSSVTLSQYTDNGGQNPWW